MLEIRAGGGLYCTSPRCVLTLRDFRHINISTGASIATHTLAMSAHTIIIGGSVFAQRFTINAGSLHLLEEGLLSGSSRQERSRIDMHVGPGAVPHSDSLLPEGCSPACLHCTCFQVRGYTYTQMFKRTPPISTAIKYTCTTATKLSPCTQQAD